MNKFDEMTEKCSSNEVENVVGVIDSPEALRALPVEALPGVCAELRSFLIGELSHNPGHFASSMGAVDLTVALHYVFNTPYDRIVWDVGHQAYAHKLLTGRRGRFSTNRKFGGLSGFPTPDESVYDTFTAGHASNSISAALGMAVATRLRGDSPRRNVVAVIGDASIGGGLAFEGLNNAANTPNNLLIVLNDNDMSIDYNVGSLHSYLAHLNTSKKYNDIRYRLYMLLRRLGVVNDHRRGLLLRFNNAMKSLIVGEQNIFEGLNIRYFGPFDGHDVCGIVKVLNDIKNLEGPRILHLRTVKGKGYGPAEADPAHWHAPGCFDVETGKRRSSGSIKYQDIFGRTLLQLARDDERVVAVTAAMLSGTSVGDVQAELPERVFDVGISEGHAVTFAGGMAKDGMRPVVGIYSSFLQRAYDHIIHDVAIPKLPVVFAIDRGGIVGEDGVTHHGAFDLAYLRTVPNMVVCAPSDGNMLRDLLYTGLRQSDGPFALRYPRGAAHVVDMDAQLHEVSVGRGRIVDYPSAAKVIIMSIGTVSENVAEARRVLAAEGIATAHFDMIFLKPVDVDLLERARRSGLPVLTVEDGTLNGGLGSAVSEYFAAAGGCCVRSLGIADVFVPHGTVAQLQALCGYDAASIAVAVREIVTPVNTTDR